jgi:hypothetical protein
MKKRVLAGLMAAVVCLALLSGCAAGNQQPPRDNSNDNPQGQNAPPAGNQVNEPTDPSAYPWYSAESQTNFSNLQNGGYVAEAGDCIIYVLPKDDSTLRTIRMMDKDGGNIRDLCQAVYPKFINVAGQYVFFFSTYGRSVSNGDIMRYDLLTGELITLHSDIYSSFLCAQYDHSNDLGYLIIDSKSGGGDVVYKMLFDGSSFHSDEEEPYHLLDNSPYAYDGGGRTYFSLNSLEAYRYGGGKIERLFSWNPPGKWTDVDNFVLDGSNIYVATVDQDHRADAIYKAAQSDNPEFTAIADTRAHYLQVAHGKLFYLDGSVTLQTVTHLYMLNTDGTGNLILE